MPPVFQEEQEAVRRRQQKDKDSKSNTTTPTKAREQKVRNAARNTPPQYARVQARTPTFLSTPHIQLHKFSVMVFVPLLKFYINFSGLLCGGVNNGCVFVHVTLCVCVCVCVFVHVTVCGCVCLSTCV